ncbi:MAG: ArsR family transcriptional regulator, partial [Nonomuraea sp.]|nr:ArsR family transcriptional regulator [Nonomuraea sp.]
RHGFAAAMAALLADFNAYLDRPGADPRRDLVGYVQVPLWLSEEELAEMGGRMRDLLVAKAGNRPEPGRRLYLFSPILFRIEESPPLSPGP